MGAQRTGTYIGAGWHLGYSRRDSGGDEEGVSYNRRTAGRPCATLTFTNAVSH